MPDDSGAGIGAAGCIGKGVGMDDECCGAGVDIGSSDWEVRVVVMGGDGDMDWPRVELECCGESEGEVDMWGVELGSDVQVGGGDVYNR